MKARYIPKANLIDIESVIPGTCLQATLTEDDTPLVLDLSDAVAIADSAARSDIELYTLAVPPGPTGRIEWYNTSRISDPDDGLAEDIARAVRYLTLRGKLERKPGAPHMVRFPSEIAKAAA